MIVYDLFTQSIGQLTLSQVMIACVFRQRQLRTAADEAATLTPITPQQSKAIRAVFTRSAIRFQDLIADLIRQRSETSPATAHASRVHAP